MVTLDEPIIQGFEAAPFQLHLLRGWQHRFKARARRGSSWVQVSWFHLGDGILMIVYLGRMTATAVR